MTKYEVMYIVRSGTSDEVRDATIKKFASIVEKDNGKVEKIDKMGVKKFAYPIDFKTDGYYVLMTFSAKTSLPHELERQMRISDEVVRFLVTSREGQYEIARKQHAPKENKDKEKDKDSKDKDNKDKENKEEPKLNDVQAVEPKEPKKPKEPKIVKELDENTDKNIDKNTIEQSTTVQLIEEK